MPAPMAATVASGDWPYATLHYLDADGREVNTASYGAGAWQIDTANYDKYKEFAPIAFGTTWVKGVVMNVAGDPNANRCEVVIGTDYHNLADANGIRKVLWNDSVLPNPSSDSLWTYNVLNSGTSTSTPNSTPIYDGHGDPYGSMQVILAALVIEASGNSSSVPT